MKRSDTAGRCTFDNEVTILDGPSGESFGPNDVGTFIRNLLDGPLADLTGPHLVGDTP